MSTAGVKLASQIMTKKVITVSPEMDIHKAAKIFVKESISGAPVVDDAGNFLGLLLEESLIVRDKKIHLPTYVYILQGFLTFGEAKFEEDIKKISALTVSELMDKNALTISPDSPVNEIATLMVEKNVHYLPVVKAGKLAGVVTKKDIVKAIASDKLW
jgi:CBS domain-containing protein